MSVVSIHGDLDLSTAPQLQQLLDTAVPKASKLVVDLSACDFIDSTGIALLVRAFQVAGGDKVKGSGVVMVLCGLKDQVRRVLEVVGVYDYIPITDDREEAIAALTGG